MTNKVYIRVSQIEKCSWAQRDERTDCGVGVGVLSGIMYNVLASHSRCYDDVRSFWDTDAVLLLYCCIFPKESGEMVLTQGSVTCWRKRTNCFFLISFGFCKNKGTNIPRVSWICSSVRPSEFVFVLCKKGGLSYRGRLWLFYRVSVSQHFLLGLIERQNETYRYEARAHLSKIVGSSACLGHECDKADENLESNPAFLYRRP